MHRILLLLIWITFLTLWLSKPSALAQNSIQKEIDSLLREANKNYFNDPKKAIKLGFMVEKLATSTEDYRKLQEAYTVLRNAYFYNGLMEEASYYSTKSFQLAEDKGFEKELFNAKVNQGSIWLMLGKYEKANEMLSETLHYMNQQPVQLSDSLYSATMSAILNNLAIVETNFSHWDKAKEYAERGLKIAKGNTKISQEYIRLLNNYADILQNLNRKGEGEEVLKEALKISRQIDSPIFEATTYYSLTKLYFRNSNIEQASITASKSLEIAKKKENLSIEGAIAALLYEEYKKLNMADSALKYRQIQEKTDSLSKFNSAKELMLKEELHNQFNKTIAKAKEEERNQRITFFLVVAFSIIVISVLVYFFLRALRTAKQSRLEKLTSDKLVDKITGEVEILESALEEKTTQLTTQYLKKLEKDKRIEELLQKLLSDATNSSQKTINLNSELKTIKNQNNLKEFEFIFSEVHSGFFAKLQRDFPTLTLNERRMCAMLKLQLTTKEISRITHQSVRSIEITRTRLRKKLNLTNQATRISDFLASY
jgi:tetratricopeptide (TPR) repeat protein